MQQNRDGSGRNPVIRRPARHTVRRRLIISGTALACALVACGSPVGQRSAPAPTSTALLRLEGAKSGDRLLSAEWRRFKFAQLGISFEFSPGKGKVLSEAMFDADDPDPCGPDGPNGSSMSWNLFARGYMGTFAWVVSKGFGPDSHAQGLGVQGWVAPPEGDPYLIFCGERQDVVSFGTYHRPDGTAGLVYRPGTWSGEPEIDPYERAAVVNFPDGYHDRFHAINFSWPPGAASRAEIERVIRSVRFEGVPE